MVSFVIALMVGTISTKVGSALYSGLRYCDCTYLHSGRAAAMCVAPSASSLLLLRLRLVIAPLVVL